MDDLLRAVTNVEVSLLDGRPAAPGRFVAHKLWLVRRAILPEALCRSLGGGGSPIPGLAPRHLLSLAVRGVGTGRTAAVVTVPSRADAIHVGYDTGHGRAFYRRWVAGDGLTVKVMTRGSRYEARAAAELRARAVLDRLGTLRVPRLYGHDLAGPHPYLAEQLVAGRRLSVRRDRALFLDAVFPQLCRTYRAYGVGAAPIGGYFEDGALDRLGQAVGAVAWRAAWGPRDAFLRRIERLVERDGAIAVSLGHGDVLPANLAVARRTGEVYFLDLERSREMPVAFDLLLLGVKYWHVAYIRDAIRRILAVEFPSRDYTVGEQVALYIGGRRLAGEVRRLPPATAPRARAERLTQLARHVDTCVRLLGPV